MLVGIEIVDIIGLFAEADAGGSTTKLLHQKRVVPLHNLPNQLPRHSRHPYFSFPAPPPRRIPEAKRWQPERELRALEL
uniref:Uncharacterized protein n=1 Tax=Rhizophora mucronata TaxID=61149 RepID=A0A2P2LY11_RHIMU